MAHWKVLIYEYRPPQIIGYVFLEQFEDAWKKIPRVIRAIKSFMTKILII